MKAHLSTKQRNLLLMMKKLFKQSLTLELSDPLWVTNDFLSFRQKTNGSLRGRLPW